MGDHRLRLARFLSMHQLLSQTVTKRCQWRWSLFVCVAIGGWLAAPGEANASCGDYVRIGNPRGERESHADSNAPVSTKAEGSLADSFVPPVAPTRNCRGANCQPATPVDELPPTRVSVQTRSHELLLTGGPKTVVVSAEFLGFDVVVLGPQQTASGQFRPPKGVLGPVRSNLALSKRPG